ncbi:MAG TPA: hypothetical protein ENH82_07110 [bacterium]|nr:hypothetical protein [bacterium]
MILGFGVSEETAARGIIEHCKKALSSEDSPEKIVEAIRQETKAEAEKYDKMDRATAPERYTYFFFRHFANSTVFTFDMWHINRRHACSADGWACLRTYWALTIFEDTTRIYKEA